MGDGGLGGTDIDLVVVRKGRSVRGRFSAALMAVTGKPILGRDLRKSLRAIEQSRPQEAPKGGVSAGETSP